MNLTEQIRFNVRVALVHSDERRDIFDPTKILVGLEPKRTSDGIDGHWYAHSLITISREGIQLGNHFHPYNEVFYT